MNLQNLKRGGELRKSITAPEGHVIVVADSAQIEARVTAWLAKDQQLLDLFAAGSDVYKYMASQIYNVPVDQITKDQRFIGKIATLGLGYGMGWAKFQHTLATGAMGPAVKLPDLECQRIVNMYRASRFRIQRLWQSMDHILDRMCARESGEFAPLWWDSECRLWLPNGLFLQYPFIEGKLDHINGRLVDIKYFDYQTGIANRISGKTDWDKGKKIYGGLLTENVVQALARIIVGEQMMRISLNLKETSGLPVAGSAEVRPVRRVVTMTHDEVVVCVPEDEGMITLDMMIKEMKTPPKWCPSIPLNAEGGFDAIYSK